VSHRPRKGIVQSMLARGTLAALLGITLGCGGSSPSAPTPTPVPPAPVAVPGPVTLEGISLTASPSVVTSGDQLTMNWVAPSGRGCNGGGDWVAIFRVGDPDNTGAANGHSDLWFVHLCGATSGTSTLSAPRQPGQYEFRYMVGDTGVARSNAVTVNASTSPAPSMLVPTLAVDGETASARQFGETFWVTGSGYTPGGRVTRHINPAVNGSTVITPLTADPSGNLSWAFTPTCSTFDPRNTVAIYAVDDATGRTSNTITETVTGSTSCLRP
jgi:hypothetical protein